MSTRSVLLDCGFSESGDGKLVKRHFDMTFFAEPVPEYRGTWRQGTWRCEVRKGDSVLDSIESMNPADMLDFFDRVILTAVA